MNVLILAPHTDDGELGCGGTIAKLLENNYNLTYIAFSTCEESVPVGFPRNSLILEVKAATKRLGIKAENLIIRNYPVRKFNSYRQEILEDLINLKKELLPNMVFMPCSTSIHQDHKIIYEEGLRAFKNCTCYGYELPWDNNNFITSAFYKLDEKHITAKAEAVKLYATQHFRNYVDHDFIKGLARVRGAQIYTLYAEAFEAIRIIQN
jgi:N-acetylglucosamine malate deacetylase 1